MKALVSVLIVIYSKYRIGHITGRCLIQTELKKPIKGSSRDKLYQELRLEFL